MLGAGAVARCWPRCCRRSCSAAANGLLQTLREASRLLAPLAGAGLFTLLGGGAVAAIDAATFLVAAAALLAMRVREPQPAPAQRRCAAEVAAGARHIARTPSSCARCSSPAR